MHQVDPFENLVRRIGYSVGLEDIFNRVAILVEVYAEQGDINLALWKDIVKNKYNRKISNDATEVVWGGLKKKKDKLGAEDHFANFYSSISLITKQGNQIFARSGLETLSILYRHFDDEDKFALSLRILLILFLLEADGDIWTNCILSEFNPKEADIKIQQMFLEKKKSYQKVLRTPISRKKIETVFEIQTNLSYDEYYRKIIPSRKSWAEQLGFNLLSNPNVTAFLHEQKLLVNNNFCVFYPYSDFHQSMFIKEREMGINGNDRFQFLAGLVSWFASYELNTQPINGDLSKESIYHILSTIVRYYKTGNIHKGILRHQTPLHIIYPCFYLMALLDFNSIIDLKEFLENERRSPERKLDITSLRGSEGALNLKE